MSSKKFLYDEGWASAISSKIISLIESLHKRIPFNDVVDMTIVELDPPDRFGVYMVPMKYTTLSYSFDIGTDEDGNSMLRNLITFIGDDRTTPKSATWRDEAENIITLLEEVKKIADTTPCATINSNSTGTTPYYIGDTEIPAFSSFGKDNLWTYFSKLRDMHSYIIESKDATIVPHEYITDAFNVTLNFKEFDGFSLQADITNNIFKDTIINNFKVSLNGKEQFKPLPKRYSDRLRNIFLITFKKAYEESIENYEYKEFEKKLDELIIHLTLGV